MTTRTYRAMAVLTATAVMGSAALQQAVAQQTQQQPQAQGQQGQSASGSAQDMDSFLATTLLIANQEEVAVAKMAAEKAQTQNVKQFAQMLVNDHQQAIDKLQPRARKGLGLDMGQGNTAGQNNQRAGNTQGQQNRGQSVTGHEVLQIQQQAAQQCLQLTKDLLEEKQGAEFDMGFVGMQIAHHIAMKAKLTAMEQAASPQMQSLISQMSQTVENHLEQAKQVAKQLEETELRQARR